jgi:NAD(P)-dependent dehydrogenase (short-subunit alcohol dehydrogenase family)
MGRLQEKIALVTGAGAGIGRATASVFAAEGAHVYVSDVNGAAAAETVAAIAALGHAATALTLDVSRGLDGAEGGGDILTARNIEGKCGGRVAQRRNGGNGFGGSRSVDIADIDMRALSGEYLRGCPADARASAGHKCDFPVKSAHA